MPENTYHTSVMLHECIDGLHIDPAGTYVDVTFGGGGHSKAILHKLGPEGRLFSFDQDPDAWEQKVLLDFEKRVSKGEKIEGLEYHELVEEPAGRYFRYMKAIAMMQACMACHGPQNQLSEGVRAQLAKATASPALAEVATASAMLRSLQDCPLPVLVNGSQASLVEELQQSGFLRAEFTYADSPEEDTATVLAITDKGRETLARNAMSTAAYRPASGIR